MSAAGADLVFAIVDSIGRINSLQDYPREGYCDRLKLSIFSSFADISPQGLLVTVNSELEKHIHIHIKTYTSVFLSGLVWPLRTLFMDGVISQS